MRKRKNYTSYDLKIKAAIATTRRIDLFPELKIPRTTARNWVKHGYVVKDPVFEALTQAFSSAKEESDRAKSALNENIATKELVHPSNHRQLFAVCAGLANFRFV
jgi:hypothetical protein